MAVAEGRQRAELSVEKVGGDVTDAPRAGDRRPVPVRRRQAAEQADQLVVERRQEAGYVDGSERRHPGAPPVRRSAVPGRIDSELATDPPTTRGAGPSASARWRRGATARAPGTGPGETGSAGPHQRNGSVMAVGGDRGAWAWAR